MKIHLSLVVITLLSFSASRVEGQSPWQLRKSEYGVNVFVSQASCSKFKEVKATFTVDATSAEIVALFLDVENFTEWQFKTRSARVLKGISGLELIYYAEIEVPWPLLNRDIVLHMKIIQDTTHGNVTITSQAIPEYTEPRGNLVRVRAFESTWIFKAIDKDKMMGEYFSRSDPGRLLPPHLIKSIAALGPFETILSLRQRILLKRKRSEL